MAEPKTYDELERLAGSGRLLGAPCCHRGSASSSWAALKERAAASVFEGRTPHRSSCRRHAEEERRPSTEIRPGVYLPLIAYEPSTAFLPQPAFVGERDPPTEDWMEKYKPHPRLTRGSFTDKGDTAIKPILCGLGVAMTILFWFANAALKSRSDHLARELEEVDPVYKRYMAVRSPNVTRMLAHVLPLVMLLAWLLVIYVIVSSQ